MSGILSPENLRTVVVVAAFGGGPIAAALIVAIPLRRVARAKEETNDLIYELTGSLRDHVSTIDASLNEALARIHALEGYVGQLLGRFMPGLHPYAELIAPTATVAKPDPTTAPSGAAYPAEHPRNERFDDTRSLPQRVVGPPFDRDNPDPAEVARCMHGMLPADSWFDDPHPEGNTLGGRTWFDYIRAQLATRYNFLMTQDLIRRVWDEIHSWKSPA